MYLKNYLLRANAYYTGVPIGEQQGEDTGQKPKAFIFLATKSKSTPIDADFPIFDIGVLASFEREACL